MADSAVKAHCPRHGSPLPPACPECLALMEVDPDTMTGEERAAELEAFGEILTVEFDKFHRRVEQLVGRPVWTHEMATTLWPTLVEEARTQRHPADLEAHVIGSLDQVAGNKPVIVAKPRAGDD
jgi:hypothetical protein